MLLRIRHRTTYRYDAPVQYSVQALRLTPRLEPRQRSLGWRIDAPGRRNERLDAHGNIANLLTLERLHREIEIVVSGEVEIVSDNELVAHDGILSPLAYLASTRLTAPDPALHALAHEHLRGTSERDRLYALAAGVAGRVRYRAGATSVEDSAVAALERGEGVCQDQAHVFIACCRSAGIPARYVSGYLYGPDESAAAASHAWVDAWLPERQCWLGIDVTHLAPASAHHCRLAVGRDYLDAAPVRGVRHGGGHELLEVDVTVSRADVQ